MEHQRVAVDRAPGPLGPAGQRRSVRAEHVDHRTREGQADRPGPARASIRAPGLTTATGSAEAGNQVTAVRLPRLSHGRAAAATATVPAAGKWPERRRRSAGGAAAGAWSARSTGRRPPRRAGRTSPSPATRRPRSPSAGDLRDRRADGQLLGVGGAERPAERAGPANDHVDRHLLARRGACSAASGDHGKAQRDRLAVRPKRPRLRSVSLRAAATAAAPARSNPRTASRPTPGWPPPRPPTSTAATRTASRANVRATRRGGLRGAARLGRDSGHSLRVTPSGKRPPGGQGRFSPQRSCRMSPASPPPVQLRDSREFARDRRRTARDPSLRRRARGAWRWSAR